MTLRLQRPSRSRYAHLFYTMHLTPTTVHA